MKGGCFMIKNNLKVLLEQENISINKLALDTGISRQALTSIANNETSGMQFETIDTLLNYFNVSIDKFFYEEKEELTMTFRVVDIDSSIVKNDNTRNKSFRESNKIVGISIKKRNIKNDNKNIEYQTRFICSLLKNEFNTIIAVSICFLSDYLADENITQIIENDTGDILEIDTNESHKVLRQTLDKIISNSEAGFKGVSINLASKALESYSNDHTNPKIYPFIFVSWDSGLKKIKKTHEEIPKMRAILEPLGFGLFPKDHVVTNARTPNVNFELELSNPF